MARLESAQQAAGTREASQKAPEGRSPLAPGVSPGVSFTHVYLLCPLVPGVACAEYERADSNGLRPIFRSHGWRRGLCYLLLWSFALAASQVLRSSQHLRSRSKVCALHVATGEPQRGEIL